jgi:hypothetical protein
MVPAEFWDQPENHCPGMLEMVRDGVVEQEPIYPHTSKLPDFEKNFIAFLKSNPRFSGGLSGEWESVHLEKIGYGPLGEFLQQEGLAKPERGMWMRMEPQTADDFMAYLAVCVANCAKDNEFLAVTDDQRVLSRLAAREAGQMRVNQRAVNSLFPSPSEEVDLRDIIEFRVANKKALDRLRSEVQRRIDRSILSHPENAEKLFDLELQDLKDQAEQIKTQMTRPKWGQLSFGSLTGLGSAIFGAEPLLDGMLTSVDGAVAFGLLSAAATTVSGMRRAPPNGLMAYAALAGREFG